MDQTSLWWLFVTTLLAAVVLVGALAVAMMLAARRRLADQQALSRRLLEAQEQERARVAREVHDDAIQRLAALSREVELLGRQEGQGGSPQGDGLRGIAGEVDDLIVSLRRLAHGLHPAVLTQAGLPETLQQVAESAMETWDVRVECVLPDARVDVTRDRQLALYRIAQEALRNVAVHSGAHQARLTLTVDQTQVVLEIADEGRGMRETGKRAGLGLVAMGERARLVGGSLEVRSAPERGTVVIARVPRS